MIETMIATETETETQVGTATATVHHAGEMIATVIGTTAEEEEIATEAIATEEATEIATETTGTGETDPAHREEEMTTTVPHDATTDPLVVTAPTSPTGPRETKKKTNLLPQLPHREEEAKK